MLSYTVFLARLSNKHGYGWGLGWDQDWFSGTWPDCYSSEDNGLPLPFFLSLCLPPFLSIFHTLLLLFLSSLLLPWSSLHITLCSLEQSYYRNLINNKFQPSDRSIKCMIRRSHYRKWKMHKRMPTAWVNLQPGEAEPRETSKTKQAILGHFGAFISSFIHRYLLKVCPLPGPVLGIGHAEPFSIQELNNLAKEMDDAATANCNPMLLPL